MNKAFFVVTWDIASNELHGPFGELEHARNWAVNNDQLDPDEACIIEVPSYPIVVK